jgi:AcrR family transcriptional regulator
MNARSSGSSRVQRLKERLRDEAIDVILAAAEEVFARHGLHGAHMAAIAGRAGVAVGTLYNYFEDRDALLGAVVDARHKELVARLDARIEEVAERRFDEQLRAVIATMAEHVEAHRPLLLALMHESAQGSTRVAKPQAAIRAVHKRLERVFAAGVREKALRAADADVYPALFMSVLRALLLAESLDGGGEPARMGERLERLFLHGAGYGAGHGVGHGAAHGAARARNGE